MQTTHPMTPSYPLPLIDGDAILIDNSMLETFRQCERKFEYRLVTKRVPVDGAAALTFGSGIHHALAWRYRTVGSALMSEANQVAQLNELKAFFETHPLPQVGHRQPSLAYSLVEMYNKVYREEPWRIIQGRDKPVVEASFPSDATIGLLGLARGYRIIYAGRLDLAIEDSIGEWVQDHKTAFMFGKGFEQAMRLNPQFIGYVWSFTRHFGRKPLGFVVNGIRVRKPTKEDDLVNWESKGVRRDDFTRIYEPVSDDRVEEWVENTLKLCERMVDCYRDGYFPMNNHSSCVSKYGTCSYYHVCNSPRASRPGILAMDNFEDNEWSPLNQPMEQETD